MKRNFQPAPEDLDVEAHLRSTIESEPTEDTEGHLRVAAVSEEDVEGHLRVAAVSEEDVEGHLRVAAVSEEDVESHHG